MRLQSIELIRRENGLFHHPTNGRSVKAFRPNAGVGVCVQYNLSQLDYDFRYLYNNQEGLFWFPTVDELIRIQDSMDRSDELTFQMLKTEWEGIRPRKLKVADFI